MHDIVWNKFINISRADQTAAKDTEENVLEIDSCYMNVLYAV